MEDKTKSPFVVPPFNAGKRKTEPNFYWWSWHPNYTYWSKSCWGGRTIEEAKESILKDSKMELYHNKLIKEENGQFIEIEDSPCQRMDIWWNIYKYQELEKNYGPRTALLQRRLDYAAKHDGLVDHKFFIKKDAIELAKSRGATTAQLVESIADELLKLEDAKTIPHKELY